MGLIKLDIGSGGFKRPGYVGIDILPPGENNHDIDIVCDIEKERWPIEDNSVSHIFSSHCFEHVSKESIPYIFKEMSRVAADGCKIEIWNPYAFHRDGHVIGHITYLTEELYYHICCGMQAGWSASLGAKWFLEEIRYHVDTRAIESLQDIGIHPDLAINHFNNVVKEFGVFIFVDKTDRPLMHWVFNRVMVDDSSQYGGAPMRETRNENRRILTVGQYVPQLRREKIAVEQAALQAAQFIPTE